MNTSLEPIIHDGDIDFSIAFTYIKKYWAVILLFTLAGLVGGGFMAKREHTTYTIQALLKTPPSWQYVEPNSQAVLYQFAKQFSKAYPDYLIDVSWTVFPKDEKGNEAYALVNLTCSSLTREKGIDVFTKFVNDLSATTQVLQMNEKAQQAVQTKMAEVRSNKASLQQSLQTFKKLAPTESTALTLAAFEQATTLDQQLDALEKTTKSIGPLQWLTDPGPANSNPAKPWYFFVFALGVLGAILGSFIAILPGLISTSHERKQ